MGVDKKLLEQDPVLKDMFLKLTADTSSVEDAPLPTQVQNTLDSIFQEPEEENIGLIDSMGRGFMSGLGGVQEALGGAQQFLGEELGIPGLKRSGAADVAGGQAIQQEYSPPEDIQVDLLTDIQENGLRESVLFDPRWLAFNLPAIIPSIGLSAAASMTGVGAASVAGQAIRWGPKAVKIAQAIGGMGMGTITDNLLVGGDVYNRAKEKGMSDEEAAERAASAMLGNTPLAVMQTAPFVGKVAGDALSAANKAGRMSNLLEKAGESRALATGLGSVQEGGQEALANFILEEDISQGVLEGLILGGIAEGGMAMRTSKINQKIAGVYDRAVEGGREKVAQVVKAVQESRQSQAEQEKKARVDAANEARGDTEGQARTAKEIREDRVTDIEEILGPEAYEAERKKLVEAFSTEEYRETLVRAATKMGMPLSDVSDLTIEQLETTLQETGAINEGEEGVERPQVRSHVPIPESIKDKQRRRADETRKAVQVITEDFQTFTNVDIGRGLGRRRPKALVEDLKKAGEVPKGDDLVDFAIIHGVDPEAIITKEGELYLEAMDRAGIPTEEVVKDRRGKEEIRELSFAARRSLLRARGVTAEEIKNRRNQWLEGVLRKRGVALEGIDRVVQAIEEHPLDMDMLDALTTEELVRVAKVAGYGSRKPELINELPSRKRLSEEMIPGEKTGLSIEDREPFKKRTKQQIAHGLRRHIARKAKRKGKVVPTGSPGLRRRAPVNIEETFGIRGTTEEEIRAEMDILTGPFESEDARRVAAKANIEARKRAQLPAEQRRGLPEERTRAQREEDLRAVFPQVGEHLLPETMVHERRPSAEETRLAQIPPIREGQEESLSLDQLLVSRPEETIKMSAKGLAATLKRFKLTSGKRPTTRTGMAHELEAARKTLEFVRESNRDELMKMQIKRVRDAAKFMGISRASRKPKMVLVNEMIEKRSRIMGETKPASFLPDAGRVRGAGRRGRTSTRTARGEGGFRQPSLDEIQNTISTILSDRNLHGGTKELRALARRAGVRASGRNSVIAHKIRELREDLLMVTETEASTIDAFSETERSRLAQNLGAQEATGASIVDAARDRVRTLMGQKPRGRRAAQEIVPTPEPEPAPPPARQPIATAPVTEEAPPPLSDEDIAREEAVASAIPPGGPGVPVATTPVVEDIAPTPDSPTTPVSEPAAPAEVTPVPSPQETQEPILDRADRFIDEHLNAERPLPEGFVPDGDTSNYEAKLDQAESDTDVSRAYAEYVVGVRNIPADEMDALIDETIDSITPDALSADAMKADGPQRQAIKLAIEESAIAEGRTMADVALSRIEGRPAPQPEPEVRVIPEGRSGADVIVTEEELVAAKREEQALENATTVDVGDDQVAIVPPNLLSDADLLDYNFERSEIMVPPLREDPGPTGDIPEATRRAQFIRDDQKDTINRITGMMSAAKTERDAVYVARAYRRKMNDDLMTGIGERGLQAVGEVDPGVVAQRENIWNLVVAMGADRLGVSHQEFVDKVATFHRSTDKPLVRRLKADASGRTEAVFGDTPVEPAPEPSLELDHDMFVANVFENLILAPKDQRTLAQNAEEIARMRTAFRPNELKSLQSHARRRMVEIRTRQKEAEKDRDRQAELRRAQGPERQPNIRRSQGFEQPVGGRFEAFAGRRANTADFSKLAEAIEMDRERVSPGDIWRATMWFKGEDGKWRFEISDADATLLKSFRDLPLSIDSTTSLGDIFDHPQLYDAYPELRHIPVQRRDAPYEGGTYFPVGTIQVEGPSSFSDEGFKSLLVHEIQHFIQYKEGFAHGSNPGSVIFLLSDEAVAQTGRRIADSIQGEIADTKKSIETARRVMATPEFQDMWNNRAPLNYVAPSQELNTLIRENREAGYRPSFRDPRDRAWDILTSTNPEQTAQAMENDTPMREKMAEDLRSGDRSLIEDQVVSRGFADAEQDYHRLAGEVEARNVSSRLRNNANFFFPRRTEDVPKGQQHLLFSTMERMRQESDANRPTPAEAAQGAIENVEDMPDIKAVGDTDMPPVARGRTLASVIIEEVKQGRVSDLKGKKLLSLYDMAVAGQIFRDPRVETLRLVYTKSGEVVGGASMTSRLPGVVSDFWVDEDMHREVEQRVTRGELTREAANQIYDNARQSAYIQIRSEMKALEADGYYLLHNHPTGDPMPSDYRMRTNLEPEDFKTGNVMEEYGDLAATRSFAKEIPGFQGHVIIDSHSYGYIDTDFNVNERDLPSSVQGGSLFSHPIENPALRGDRTRRAEISENVEERAKALIGTRATKFEDIADRGDLLNVSDGAIALFFVNAESEINSVYEMPLAEFFDSDVETKIRNMAAEFGAGRVMGYYASDITKNADLALGVDHLLTHGYLEDFVYDEGGVANSRERVILPETQGRKFGLPGYATRFEQPRKILPDNIPDVIEERLEEGNGKDQQFNLGEFVSSVMTNIRVGLSREFENLPRATTGEAKRLVKELNIPLKDARERLAAFGPLRQRLNQLLKEREISRDSAARELAEIKKDITEWPISRIFDYKILHDDLVGELESDRPLFDTNNQGPFGHTEASLRDTKAYLDSEVDASPKMQEALERRKVTMKKIQDMLIEAWKPFGIDLTNRFSNPHYFRHQVLFYFRNINGGTLSTPSKLPQLRNRTGLNGLDINTSYVEAEGEVIASMLYSIEVANVLKYVKDNFDISQEIRALAAENGVKMSAIIREVAPDHEFYRVDGRSEGSTGKPNIMFMGTRFGEDILADNNLIEAFKVQGVDEDAIVELEDQLSAFPLMVVPTEIAKTLNALENKSPTTRIGRFYQKSVAMFKANMLVGPFRFLRYNTRNMVGDADFTYLGNASIFSRKNIHHISDAMGEIYNTFGRNMEPSADLQRYMELGGTRELLLSQEILDEDTMRAEFELLTGEKSTLQHLWQNFKRNPFKTYFSVVGRASNMREALLRYANYRHFKEQMETDASGQNLPRTFGASIPEEIMAEPDIDRRAFKLSNDLLGAYDEVSTAGKWMRQNVFWFWSWIETAARRYKQIISNARREGELINSLGRTVLGGAAFTGYGAFRVGVFTLKAHMLWAMLAAFNNAFFPDDEEELDDQQRRRIHILGPSEDENTIRYFNRLGSLQEVLEWFGLDDWPYDVMDFLNGRRTLEEIAYDSVSSMPNKIINASRADIKAGAELLARQQFFPEAFKPRAIRDRGLHVARSLGLESLYRTMTDLPRRSSETEVLNLVSYRVDVREANYRDLYDEVNRWLERRGESKINFHFDEKSNALYNLKLSYRLGDEKAQQVWLERYIVAGGDINGMRQGFERLQPLAGLTNEQRTQYLNSIAGSKRGQRRLVQAIRWYSEVLIGEDGIEGIVRDALPYLQTVSEGKDFNQFLRRSMADALDLNVRAAFEDDPERAREFSSRADRINQITQDIFGGLNPSMLKEAVPNARERRALRSTIRRRTRDRVIDEVLGIKDISEP